MSNTAHALSLKNVMMTVMCGLTMGLTACNKPADAPKAADDKTVSTPTPTNGNATKGKKIRIATEGGYAPFNFSKPDGSLGGFDVDVANAVCAQMQADCNIVAQDWEGILPGLMTKKYDAIVSAMSITPERATQVDFTTPYFKNTMVWLAPSSGAKFNLQTITGLRLGSQRSTTLGTFLQDKYGKTNDVKLYDKYDNAYLDLKSGRLDAVLAEKVPTKDWLTKNSDKFGIIGDEIDNNDNIAIAVRKDDSLKNDFNTALAAIKASGELASLEKKYFGDSHAVTASTTTNPTVTKTVTSSTTAVSDKTAVSETIATIKNP